MLLLTRQAVLVGTTGHFSEILRTSKASSSRTLNFAWWRRWHSISGGWITWGHVGAMSMKLLREGNLQCRFLRQAHDGKHGVAPCSPLYTCRHLLSLKVWNSTLHLTMKGSSFIQVPCSDLYWAATTCQASDTFLIYSSKQISEAGSVPKHIDSERLRERPKLTLTVRGKGGFPIQVSLIQTFTPVWALLWRLTGITSEWAGAEQLREGKCV